MDALLSNLKTTNVHLETKLYVSLYSVQARWLLFMLCFILPAFCFIFHLIHLKFSFSMIFILLFHNNNLLVLIRVLSRSDEKKLY